MIDEIKKLQVDIDRLGDEQQFLALSVVSDTKRYTLNQRFEIWSKYVIKKEEPCVIDASQYPIIGQMVDDCFPYDYDKYRTYDWEYFLFNAVDNFEDHQDPEVWDSGYHKPRFTTQESIDALKEEMITLNFGSFEMDW